MQRYENIDKKLHKELSKLDKKLENDAVDLNTQDLELIDCIYHALKSAEGYYAMQEASYDMDSGRSYRSSRDESYARGRDSRGRYSSRDMDGYSGHYPEWMPPMYPRY